MKVKDPNGKIILEKEMPRVTHAIISSFASAHLTGSGQNHQVTSIRQS